MAKALPKSGRTTSRKKSSSLRQVKEAVKKAAASVTKPKAGITVNPKKRQAAHAADGRNVFIPVATISSNAAARFVEQQVIEATPRLTNMSKGGEGRKPNRRRKTTLYVAGNNKKR